MAFSITDVLMPNSMAAAPKKKHSIERISYYNLVPSEKNFYSMAEIEELKTAIELAGRVLDNLVVTPLPDGKYRILSGHRRHAAVGLLLEEGKEEYEFLPCSVEQIEDSDREVREQVLLLAANSQREKTAWDKLEEVRHMRDLQRQAKAEQGLNGRVRDLVAQSLHMSASRVAKYDSILNNLCAPLLKEIKADRLSITTAYDLSKLPADRQEAAYAYFTENGRLPSAGDVFVPNTREVTPGSENVFVPNTRKAATEQDDVFVPNTRRETSGKTNVFVPNTLPGDGHRLVCQLTELSVSRTKLNRLAKLLDTTPEQLTADLSALLSDTLE